MMTQLDRVIWHKVECNPRAVQYDVDIFDQISIVFCFVLGLVLTSSEVANQKCGQSD